MEKYEDKILKLITLIPLLIISIFMALVIFIVIELQNTNLQNMINKVEQNLIAIEKDAIKNKILDIADLINHKNSIILKELKVRVSDRVETAYKISLALHKQYKDIKTQDEIKNLITTTIRPLLWNKGESFIWILDYNGVFQLAPTYLKHFEGSSILNFKDATGRFVIKEEINICKTKGSGFLKDTFTKPNDSSKKQYEQIVFVKAFGHYDWYIGSGEYIDTAINKSDNALLESIKKVSANTSGYIFVINTEGKILLNQARSELVGSNMSQSDDVIIKDTIEKIKKKS